MLKSLYKFILVSVLSGSLLMMNTVAVAQTASGGTTQKVKTDGIKDGDMMSTLTMTSIGLLTSRLYKCKLTTDMMIAAAAGAAFLGGEVMAAMGLKKVMKDLETEITRDDKGKIDQKQIESLEKLKKSYEEAKKTANTKKMLQMASAAAFAAAAVMAGMQYMKETAANKACTSALQASAGQCAQTCAKLSSNPHTAAAAPPFCNGGPFASIAAGLRSVREALRMTPAPSATNDAKDKAQMGQETGAQSSAAVCPINSGAISTCKAGETIMATTTGVCMVPPSAALMSPALKNNVYANFSYQQKNSMSMNEILSTIFMPKAHADLFSPMGIASSAAISFVLATNVTLGVKIDSFMFSPMNRGMVWGVLGGLVFMATSATNNQIQKIEENIKKIDAILNDMYSHTNGVASNKGTTIATPKVSAAIPGSKVHNLSHEEDLDVDLKSQGGGNLPCITSDEAGKCPSFSDQVAKIPMSADLPDSVQTAMGNITKMADGLNGTSRISKSTLGAGRSLASQSNALKSEMEKSQKNLQLLFKDKRDLKKEAADFEADVKGVMKKELDARKMNAGQMLANFSGYSKSLMSGSGSGSATDGASSQTAEEKNAKDSAANNMVNVPAGDIPKIEPFKLGNEKDPFSDEKAKDLAAMNADGTDGKASSIDDYELKNDINESKETSLFEVISHRYQKSGYPRLFRKIKE